MTCGGCHFFDVIVVHEDDEMDASQPDTICRRYPPADGAWSVVLADDWCGEWKENQR